MSDSFLSVVVEDDWTEDKPPVEVTLSRRAPPANDGHGRAVRATATVSTMTASIQPYTGRKLAALAAANETTEIHLVLTKTTIDVATEDQEADEISNYLGATWRVIEADHYSERGVGWTRAYIARTKAP
jgi:hypothetical protein